MDFLSSNKVAIMKDGSFIDFGKPNDVINEYNLRNAYNINVELIELDETRKVCVPMKTNISLNLDINK